MVYVVGRSGLPRQALREFVDRRYFFVVCPCWRPHIAPSLISSNRRYYSLSIGKLPRTGGSTITLCILPTPCLEVTGHTNNTGSGGGKPLA